MVRGEEMEKSPIEDVMNRYQEQILEYEGVVGIGVGQSATGELCIKVFVDKREPSVEEQVPGELEGYPVEIEEVGDIKAL
jgi:hypothetical protein